MDSRRWGDGATAVLAAALVLVALPARAEPWSPSPFAPPRGPRRQGECGTTRALREDFARSSQLIRETLFALGDAVLPDVGASYDNQEGLRPVLAWSFAVPFGPEHGQELRTGWCFDEVLPGLRPHRVALEGGFSLAPRAHRWLRVGYGFVWHPKRSKVGLVLGAGPTLRLQEGRHAASIGPELGLRYGECCSPGFSRLTVRYDERFIGEAGRSLLFVVGINYW